MRRQRGSGFVARYGALAALADREISYASDVSVAWPMLTADHAKDERWSS